MWTSTSEGCRVPKFPYPDKSSPALCQQPCEGEILDLSASSLLTDCLAAVTVPFMENFVFRSRLFHLLNTVLGSFSLKICHYLLIVSTYTDPGPISWGTCRTSLIANQLEMPPGTEKFEYTHPPSFSSKLLFFQQILKLIGNLKNTGLADYSIKSCELNTYFLKTRHFNHLNGQAKQTNKAKRINKFSSKALVMTI